MECAEEQSMPCERMEVRNKRALLINDMPSRRGVRQLEKDPNCRLGRKKACMQAVFGGSVNLFRLSAKGNRL